MTIKMTCVFAFDILLCQKVFCLILSMLNDSSLESFGNSSSISSRNAFGTELQLPLALHAYILSNPNFLISISFLTSFTE